MKSKNPSALFDLIKTLTPAEKGYFKKYVSHHGSSDKAYLKLFDLLNAQKEYDEEKVRHRSKKQLANFSGYKNYTYNLLLDALREYHKAGDGFNPAASLISNTNLLAHKNLYDQALEFVEQADAIAKENDEPLLRIAALERESILLNISNNEAGLKEFYHTGFKKYEELMDEIRLNWKIRKCFNWLRIYKITQSQPILKTEAEDFIKQGEELLRELPFDRLANFEKLTYHQLAAVISTTRRYLIEARHHYHQMLKLYDDKKLMSDYYFDYVMALNQNILFNLQYGFKDESLYHKLNVVAEKSAGTNQQIARAMAKRVRYHLSLMKYNREGNFKLAEKVVAESMDWLRRNEKNFSPRIKVQLYYEQAITHFGVKNYSKALLCIQHILQTPKSVERTMRLSAMMLEILIQYETGETEHMLKLTRIFYKELLHYRLSSSCYRLFSDWFAETIRRSPGEVKKRIAAFYPKVNQLIQKESPTLEVLLSDFLMPWLKSKADTKDFIATMKEFHSDRTQPS